MPGTGGVLFCANRLLHAQARHRPRPIARQAERKSTGKVLHAAEVQPTRPRGLPGAHAFGYDVLGSMKCAARHKAGRATHSCGTVGKVSGTKKPPGAECAGLNPAANRNRSNRAPRSMHARNRVVRMRTHRCDQIANRARWAQNAGTRDRSDGTWRGRCCSPRNCGASLSNGHWRRAYLSAGGSALCGNVSVLFSKRLIRSATRHVNCVLRMAQTRAGTQNASA